MAPPKSMSEGEYVSALVETVRVMNVNLTDWSVDCVSEYGYKRYFDIQVMSPYFHFNNGEGMYIQPEVGALAWLCRPSGGRFGAPFLLGFQAPYDEYNASFRSGRQTLNAGDIMLRTRDENFMVLRRGGVVQIGATPTAQRMYIPLQNTIRDFCENYELYTFGGEMTWIIDRDDQTTDGEALTRFDILAKSKANEPDHVVRVGIGSHGEDEPTKMSIEVYESGADDAELKIDLTLTEEGDVVWDIEQDWMLTVKRDILCLTEDGSITMDAADTGTWSAQKKVLVKSSQDEAVLDGMKKALVTSSTQVELEAPLIKLGSGASSEPVVLGLQLTTILTKLISQIAAFQFVAPLIPASPAPVIAAPAVASISADLANMISKKSFVE
jgi:hypothetical protein